MCVYIYICKIDTHIDMRVCVCVFVYIYIYIYIYIYMYTLALKYLCSDYVTAKAYYMSTRTFREKVVLRHRGSSAGWRS